MHQHHILDQTPWDCIHLVVLLQRLHPIRYSVVMHIIQTYFTNTLDIQHFIFCGKFSFLNSFLTKDLLEMFWSSVTVADEFYKFAEWKKHQTSIYVCLFCSHLNTLAQHFKHCCQEIISTMFLVNG